MNFNNGMHKLKSEGKSVLRGRLPLGKYVMTFHSLITIVSDSHVFIRVQINS